MSKSLNKKSERVKITNTKDNISEVELQTLPPKHEDTKIITISLNFLRHILPLYSVSDVKVSLKYLNKELGESQSVPVTDEDKIILEGNFEIPINVLDLKEVDQLASNPVFLCIIQSSGALNDALYEQLKKSGEFSPKEFAHEESLFSLYEAFAEDHVKLPKNENKKKKLKGKSAKQSGSQTSKSSKKSRASQKSNLSERSGTETELYGMCVLDLIPLFHGKTSFTETILVKPFKKFAKSLSTFKTSPEICLTVALKDSENLIEVKNILNVTVESICNVPSLMSSDMDCRIVAVLPLGNAISPTVFHNPKLTAQAPHADIPKRWPGVYDPGYTTKYLLEHDYSGTINKAKLNIEEAFEEGVPRLEFNCLKRNVMFKNSQTEFNARVHDFRKIGFEICLTPKGKKLRESQEEETGPQRRKSPKHPPFLHLLAVLDVVALLYPGVTKLRVAAPVQTFTFEEAAKCGLEDSYFMSRPKALPEKTKGDGGKKKKPETKKDDRSKTDKSSNLANKLPPKPEEPPPPECSVPVYNEDGKPCFIIIEIELLEPLTPKRDLDELRSDLHQLQLQAVTSSKIILNKHVADDFYKQTIKDIIDDLGGHWAEYSDPSGDFLAHLQKIGAYQKYLSSIMASATLLITNKYKCQEEDFKHCKEYQNLISEVFMDLTAQMHGVLNSLVCSGMKPTSHKYTTPSEVSFFWAKEAAELQLHESADRYFMERIIDNEQGDFNCWFDYAVYNLEVQNVDKAFESARESIAMSPTNKYPLLLYAALLAEKNYLPEAETCLLNVLIQESRWLEGWGVLYLFYQMCDRPDGMEVAMAKATEALDSTSPQDRFHLFEDLAWSWKNVPNTVFFRTAIVLLKMRLFSWVELALAEEILVPKHRGHVNYMLAIVSYYRHDYDHALEHVEEAKDALGLDSAFLALSGHALYRTGRLDQARNEYMRVLESFTPPDNIHLVYLNCAEILTKLGDDQRARKLVLVNCAQRQTPHSWFMAGKLYYQENDILSAEECFSEANMKDNRHAEVWGYLALVNLKMSRMNEAEQCYQQAVKSNLADEELTRLIKDEFQRASYCAF